MTDVTTTARPPGLAGRWLALGVLLSLAALLTIDLGGLWQALPALSEDLGASSNDLLWINDGYGLATAATMIVMGNLADRWGARRVLLAGCAGFLVASLLAAFAASPAVLIGARLLLGVSGAAIIPSALAVIAQLFPEPALRARAIALWIGALSAGVALGPVLGGLLLRWFWWGAVFLLAVPVMLAAMLVVPRVVSRGRGNRRTPVDVPSVGLLSGGLTALLWGIKQTGADGPTSTGLLALGLGAAALAAFGRRQDRLAQPLVDLRLFGDRRFAAAVGLLVLTLTAMNGVHYLVPTVLQAVTGATPFEAGLWLLPSALGLVLGAQLTPPLAARFGPGVTVALGACLAVVGFGVLAADLTRGGSAPVASLTLTLALLGLAPMTVLGTGIAVDAVPPERAGHASAIGQTGYELGLVLGIAVTGTVAAAVYRASVLASVPPALPESRARGIADSLGGGLGHAQQGGPSSGETVDAVRAAVGEAAAVAATVSGALAVVLGVLGLVLLRARR